MIQGEKTMIQLRIKHESELYNHFDPTGTRINDDVYRYLKTFSIEPEFRQNPRNTLRIISDGPVDLEKFQKLLQNAVKRDLDEFDAQITRNNRRVIWEFITGIALSAIGVLLTVALDQVLLAIISFIGSMAIRDAITTLTKVNHDIKSLRKLLVPFTDLTLEVVRNVE